MGASDSIAYHQTSSDKVAEQAYYLWALEGSKLEEVANYWVVDNRKFIVRKNTSINFSAM